MTDRTPETEGPASDKRARLAELLRRRAGHDDSAHPLSHGQQALWFLHQLAPGTAAYNVVFGARVHSPLDVGALTRALRELTARQPILRATFEAREGRPVQRLRPLADVAIETIDARGLAGDALAAAVTEAAQRPFDLQQPLVRAALVTRAADDHVLILAVHHLVVDGWSFGLLLDDLFQLYAHEAAGGAPPAAAETAQYLDFVRWQSELLDSAEGTRLRTYWEQTLGGELPVLDLPTDRPRPAVVGLRGSSVGFALDEDLTTRLKRLATAEGTTPFVVMLAALQALLARYTGQTDILVGSPVAGRGRPAFERIVGNCMNMVALRGDLSDDPSFRAFVERLRGRVLGALSHQDYPFPLIVKGLGADRDLSRMPVFQVTFNYLRLQTVSGVGALITQGEGTPTVEIGGLRLQSYPLPQQEGQFDLALEMTEVGSGLQGRLKYDTALFDASTAARMVGHFETLLRGAVAAPESPVSALPLLTERERDILVDWNRTERAYPLHLGLHELIEAQVERTPDRVAVQLDGESMTYRALDERANQLARRLIGSGAKRDGLVGVCMERSLELVVALLGVLKAGAAYVPLDPDYPTDRLAFMAQDAAAHVILTQPHLRGVIPATEAEVVVLEPGWAALAGESAEPIRTGVAGEHLAYTIYTSGSTGRPKGAMNTHRGIVNRLLWMQERYALGPDDRILQKTPFSFDVSVWEFFWPLMAGARLVLARPHGHKDSRYLIDLIATRGITTAHFVPSMLQVFLDEPDVSRCTSLRRVIASGEALPAELVQRFFARLSAELHNLYGPTEAAVDVTAWACRPDEHRRIVPIGRPIANTTIHVLDSHGAPVPIGVAGELHIGGVQVARGYLGRPELTEERFVPDPFSGARAARLYRTGDLARYRPDGAIEYLGRLDHQIKLRGFRIELGEIEAVLTGHPAVREAVVVAHDDGVTGPRLVAFVVPSSGATIDTASVQTHLKAALPDYMVPSTLIALTSLPLLPNGKIDRRALPLAEAVWEEPAEEYLAPRTDVERALATIWADVLKLDRVGVRGNFFALGGHSLLATRVMTRIRRDLGVDIPLRRLFEAPTVAALAADVESAGRADATSPAIPPPAPMARIRPAPASFVQRRMWFFDQVSPDSAAYNIPLILELSGPLVHERLERALAMLFERHAVLRTTLQVLDGDVVQVVEASTPRVAVLDLSALAPAEREQAVREQTTAQARRPFDLARGPLVRTSLLTLGPDSHLLAVTAHHAVLDGWSIAIFVRELAETYAALTEARPPRLSALPIAYADFAEWQRAWLTDEALAPQLTYWRGQLAGAPELLDLPADRPHPPAPTFEASVCTRVLSADVARALRGLSQREGVTMFMTILAAFKSLLFRYTGQEDLVVGSPIAGRNQPGTEDLLGVFINTLVLRTDLSGDPTFRQLLARVREVTLGAYAHQDVPVERLVEALRPGRHPDRNPLFQVLFNLLNFASSFEASGGGVEFGLRPSLDLAAAAESLTLYAFDGAEGLHLWLVYGRERFDATTAERILDHFETLVRGIADDPDRRVSALPLLPAGERQRLLGEWNATDVALPLDQTYARQFEAQVARTPDAVAAIDDGGALTYAELDGRASRLARRLVDAGVGPDRVVALLGERSLDFLTWILAVFKAGGAYLPLDPRHPAARHAAILTSSAATVVLVDAAHAAVLDAALAEMDGAERPMALGAVEGTASVAGADAAVALHGRPGDLAYVIYTSGSTGVPKGAMVEQVGMLNHLHAKIRDLGLTDADTVVQNASQCFDISVWQFLAPLLVGGRVRIVSDDVAADAPRLLALVDREAISVAEIVPSVLASAFSGASDATASSPALSRLRWLIVTGEAAPPALCRRWLLAYPHTALMNGYGPTECSDDVTHHVITAPPPADATQVPIGRPVANMRIYVLDRTLTPTPIGVPGELCVGGIGVGRGYLGDPARTAEAFVVDPFSRAPNARLYRTGDLARWNADGTLEFLGRLDHQVKIRGFRIELGEIEAVLGRHPAVREAVVMARADQRGEPRLVAYVVTEEAAPADLRQFLARVLPDYMLPESIVVMAALPLTPNGKIDRRALPDAELPSRPLADAPARTPVEEVIANVWTEVLGVERVGIHENFFELGGHSLLATRVISRVREAFAIELPVRRLFEAPTVAGLAEHVVAARSGPGTVTASPLRRRADTGALPLSFAQQRLWFLDQLEPGGWSYNIPGAVRLRGRLDVGALAGSLSEVVRRHASLRTLFSSEAGEPRQLVTPAVPVPLDVVDLSGLPAAEREAEMRRRAWAAARRPFDLARGPLFRAQVLRLDDEDHVLLVEMHHIVSDGWSLGVLVGEVEALYAAFLAGQPSPLPEPAIQYSDFAVWQRELLEGELGSRQREYWTRQLEGSPPLLGLPIDHPRPTMQTFAGALHVSRVEAEVAAAMRGLCRRHGATLFMVLLAAFKVLLHRYTGQTDILVGTPVANRSRVETEGLIGLLVNTLVLRTDLSGGPTFPELIQRVRRVALDAYSNQDLPFEQLVEVLQPARSLSYSPLFQVLFAVQNAATGPTLGLPGLHAEPLEIHHGTTKTDLTLQVVDEAEGFKVYWEYNTDLFEAATIARMAGHLGMLLAAIASDATRPVSVLPLLSVAERTQVLDEWNATDAPTREAPTVLDLIAQSRRRQPGALAVVDGTTALTYEELSRRANDLAHRLRALGVGPNVVVGIAAERSVELVVGLLGVLKAGGAYLPLDPSYPAERLQFMADDAGLEVVVTHGVASLPELRRTVTLVPVGTNAERADDPPSAATAADLAYVIYTSGSTGTPKGVEIPHRALANVLESMARTPGMNAADVLLAVTSLSFDIAALELLLPLTVGGRVVIAGRDETRDGRALLDVLRRSNATVMQATPATWRMLLAAGWQGGEGLRVLCGGEALSAELARRLLAAGGEVWNLYGPTETTIWSTAHRVESATTAPPIGRPIANTRVYVLDAEGQPVPSGVAGELHIAGHGLARGYRGRPDLTDERFVDDAFGREPGALRYRTGDLGRWRSDGTLEYLGRLDHQVKVQGYRIELGEIETALLRHPSVREAVVMARADGADDTRLVAYVVGDPAACAPSALRAFTARTLPEYMVPTSFVALPALPLTPNGKVDRLALPGPALGPVAETSAAPRTLVEELIVNVWARALGLDRVGVQENFFELGGHSLAATRVVARLREELGVELPVRVMFEAPTIAELAAHVEAALAAPGRVFAAAIRPRSGPGPFALSFAQQRLWFFEQFEPGGTTFNMSVSLRLSGPLDRETLQRSLEAIWRRHESLRTTFGAVDGRPVQRIAPPNALPLPVTNLEGLEAADQSVELERRATEHAQRPFDLSEGPLTRTALFRLADTEHILVITAHHIIVDGWSFGLLLDELATLYAADRQNAPSPLPALALQYADYAEWQRESMDEAGLESTLAYWRRTLADAARLDLPTDRPRPARQTFRGAAMPLTLSPEVSSGLRALARREGATLFMTLLAAFKAVLARHTGTEDVVVGAPVAGRTRPETETMIGFFVNTVALRDDLSGDPTFRQILAGVRGTVLGALANQDAPFEKVLESLRIDRDPSRTPLFQVYFNFMNVPDASAPANSDVVMSPLSDFRSLARDLPAKFDLSLYASDRADGMPLFLVYNADLFEAATVQTLLQQLERALTAVVASPDIRLAALPLVSDVERASPSVRPSGPFEEFPPLDSVGSIPDRFRAVVARHGDRVAVESEATVWTYRDLDAWSSRVAHAVQGAVGRPGGRVGLLLPHDAPMVAAVLGVLRSGHAYVPLDPLYPRERLAFMLEDAEAGVVVTDTRNLELARAVVGHAVRIVNMDRLESTEAAPAETSVSPDAVAYILYTSGSTGHPKGVVQSHRNVTHHIRVYTNNLHIAPADRLALLASFSFDAAVMDVFGALLNGATLCLLDVRTHGVDRLAAWLARQRITIYHSTPTLYRTLLLDRPADRFPDVRLVVLGGEEVVRRDVDLYRRHFSPGCLFVNGLGPTESTVSFQHFIDHHTPLTGWTVPVGLPVPSTELVLLDPDGRPTALRGEIGIRSAHVALEYWRRPDLTATAFLDDPAGGAARTYRTGDLGRLRPDGTLEFLGRRDDQVKVRGFRIEPAEVEAAIDAHPGVRRSVVVAQPTEEGDRFLAAYVVARSDPAPTMEELQAHVRDRLPTYMVPSVFVALEELPLTPSGKVDRRALPAPDRSTLAGSRASVPPRGSVETALAAIWSDVLEVETIGVHDDFFGLGGHSLLAMRLFSRIEQEFGVTLPLASLFPAATIAQQAELLEQQRREIPWRALVPIRPTGSHPPLFAIPGLGGIVVAFNELARLLGPDQPFYGLQPRGLDGKRPPFTTVEEAAEHYLTEIRAVQPEGPYFLMGVCMGGVVAFDIAQRLHAAGQTVAFLALLDVRPPHPMWRRLPIVRRRWSGAVTRLIASRLASYSRVLLQRPSRRQAREVIDTIKRVFTVASGGDPLRGVRGEVYHQIVMAANSAAMGRYHPRPYPGSLVLVLAAERRYAKGGDRRLAWRELATQGIDICVVPGADSGLTLVEPNVRTLAEEFRSRLRRIREGAMVTALTVAADHMAGLLTVGGV